MISWEFHPEVRRDLDEIWDFIAADNRNAANNLIAEIIEAIDAVVSFPGVGHGRPDLTGRPLRFISVREYLIAYAPHEHPCGLSL
jgi:plasmid stabilization system protein ParE